MAIFGADEYEVSEILVTNNRADVLSEKTLTLAKDEVNSEMISLLL